MNYYWCDTCKITSNAELHTNFDLLHGMWSLYSSIDSVMKNSERLSMHLQIFRDDLYYYLNEHYAHDLYIRSEFGEQIKLGDDR